MTPSKRLIQSADGLFCTFYVHPFVTGIADGTLPREKFAWYLLQDYIYLLEYTKVFAVGIAKAEDLETMQAFSESVYEILHGEMETHRAYMLEMGVTEKQAAALPASLANRSYTAYMLKTAWEGGAAEVAASILSCAVSYELIGGKILERNPDAASHPLFGRWVRSYTSPEYAAENRRLEQLTDRLAAGYDEKKMRKLEDIFLTCSRYEGAFWDMGWNMEDYSVMPDAQDE